MPDAPAPAPLAPSLHGRVSAAEWTARIDLALAFRLLARAGLTDLASTHMTARVPGEPNAFLINPLAVLFDEVTASSLIKLDLEGNALIETGFAVNRTGFCIHGAIYRRRPDAASIVHTHTRAGMAVSAMPCGLLPATQHAIRFFDRLAYHDYGGLERSPAEADARLARDLGPHPAMILRNHGLLTVGVSIPQAYALMHYLERACAAQVDALTCGERLVRPDPEACERSAREQEEVGPFHGLEWPSFHRVVARDDPSYRA